MEQERIPYLKLGYMVRFDPEACDLALARFKVSCVDLEPVAA